MPALRERRRLLAPRTTPHPQVSRPYRTGFCADGNPPDSHTRCKTGITNRGTWLPCSCWCHWKPDAANTEEPMTTITEPGVYYDLPADVYHAQHDWLSWSMMKRLVPPSTPAHLKTALAAGEVRKRIFDQGKVVHTLVLGDGEEFVVVMAQDKQKNEYEARDYKTLSAERHRDAIYDAGKVPVLRHELAAAEVMAAKVREHQIANTLLARGRAEVSLFWIDADTGVRCRARVDWLPFLQDGRRMIVPDLKTAASAAPSEFAKQAANLGYYGQQQHYIDGIKACGLADDPAFVFVVVEKEEPHLVIVGQFADRDDLRLARATVDRCRRIYAECVATDTWPGYGTGIHNLQLPNWLHYQLEEFTA